MMKTHVVRAGLVGIVLGSIGFLFACKGSKKDAYVAEIQQWHQQRIENLKTETGWLNLVALEWLDAGENTFGSDSTCDVLFPSGKAPGKMGVFYLQNDSVWVEIAPGVPVTHNGQAVQRLWLRPDTEGKPTLLALGSLRWFIIKRGNRYGVRLRDLEAPLVQAFTGIDMYPIDPAWRVTAQFRPYDPPKTIAVPTVLGTVTQERCPGALVFQINGKKFELDPIAAEGAESLFLVIGDETNGDETYGGGRFLVVPMPDASGRTVIDFNKAYNPPCAFTPYATCPLPPKQNRLPVRITAGEKVWGEGHH